MFSLKLLLLSWLPLLALSILFPDEGGSIWFFPQCSSTKGTSKMWSFLIGSEKLHSLGWGWFLSKEKNRIGKKDMTKKKGFLSWNTEESVQEQLIPKKTLLEQFWQELLEKAITYVSCSYLQRGQELSGHRSTAFQYFRSFFMLESGWFLIHVTSIPCSLFNLDTPPYSTQYLRPAPELAGVKTSLKVSGKNLRAFN